MKLKDGKNELNAGNTDKFVLYQDAVQNPVDDVRFLKRVYRERNGRDPLVMREDFCGTALLCAEWVVTGQNNRAIGVDLCKETLDWGREHNLKPLRGEASRIQLLNRNVLDVTSPKADVVMALNFSYGVFKTRELYRKYFETIRKTLNPGGIYIMDAYGGPDVIREHKERRKCKGFTYVWETASWKPVTNELLSYIHFEFPDGSKKLKAFTYDWRLWSLPEMKELLLEAGFKHVDIYWEGSEGKKGNGIFKRTKHGVADDCWISYVVAFR